MVSWNQRAWFFVVCCCLASWTVPTQADLPDASLNLSLKAPIKTWDEAVPLGNGLMGGLLWGDGNRLKLSLDRGDLWDLRTPAEIAEPGFTYANLQRLVKARNTREIARLTDKPYDNPTPTKIPAGRLEIDLPSDARVERFELDLATAQGRALLAGGRRCTAFFSAAESVAILKIEGDGPVSLRLLVPGSGQGETGPDSHAVASLGYPPANHGEDGPLVWFTQETAGPLRYCVLAGSRKQGDSTQIALTIASTDDGPDPLAIAKRRVNAALDRGYETLLPPHSQWWQAFWSRSTVVLPDPKVMRHLYLVRYFYGSASRRESPPMPLQGVWTADAGTLPPWKGDYHNDLNTQMSYMGYQAPGHFDEGLSFLDLNTRLLPRYRRFAREFFGAPGAAVPGVMSLAGDPLCGWAQYSLSPVMGAWIGHLYYLHWRYTGDDSFLKERAYPWCREVGDCLRALLKPDDRGVLVLPLSSSPEVHDNSLKAWMTPNTNHDLACIKMLFLALAEMTDAVGDREASARWAESAKALGGWHLGESGVLKLDAREELAESHRHLGSLMAIHPFNLITIEGSDEDRRIIQASLDQYDRLGTRAWVGFSFSWMAAVRARVGDAPGALKNLDVFLDAFLLRNGFHANGDQSGRGHSGFTYRPFTLEGNMLVSLAVHEMLLQSWSPTPGRLDTEVIRLFPASPDRWQDASFQDLRAEGGHRVSARRENGRTTWFRVVAGRDGIVRIRDNFGGRAVRWNRDSAARVGDNFEVRLKTGEVLEGRIDAE